MQNILSKIPERTIKPRNRGLTMMIDKGLSLNQAENFLEVNSTYTDIIKLGFGTSIITPNITKKIQLYQKYNMLVYAGGTLFEAFVIRNQIKDYKKYLNNIGVKMVEISDGSINIKHNIKCNYISDFAKDFKVISEVGSKDVDVKICAKEWIQWMQNELKAGSWKVIAESRESGNIGIFEHNGSIKSNMVDEITQKIDVTNIMWETPKKEQQTWFINKFGANVNLGNISKDDITSLECLRLGLRADTFKDFIEK